MAGRSAYGRRERSVGARAPLFERLADDSPHTQRESRPFRSHDREGLEASLQRELEQLLNTRHGPLPDHAVVRRTVLGYGVPDHILDSPTSTRDQERLERDVATAIRAFEPRLVAVSVAVHQADPRSQRLTLVIDGEAMLDRQRLAVRFPVVIGGTTT